MRVFLQILIVLLAVLTELLFVLHVTETSPFDTIPMPAGLVLWVAALLVVPFVLPELFHAVRAQNDETHE